MELAVSIALHQVKSSIWGAADRAGRAAIGQQQCCQAAFDTSIPQLSSISASVKSMPDVIPADVQTLPSLKNIHLSNFLGVMICDCLFGSDLHFLLLPVGFSDVPPKYLPEGRHRHPVPEIDPLRNLEARQTCLAVGDELGFANGTTGLQRHRRYYYLAPLGIPSTDHSRHFDSGVAVTHR